MRVCEELEPKKVFAYFEDISQIPHGSRNTKAVSDYCVEFAKAHGLTYMQDEENNVIIFKDASAGYENSEPVIIQGHLDMVCEKEDGVAIDFEKDGLKLYIDGDFLKAEGTTLGGDDGIAVAYALAILDDDTLEHPPLEEEGIFLASCAGGLQAVCEIPVSRVDAQGISYEIKVTGLQGGHSGAEIDKERGNAVWLLGRVLQVLGEKHSFAIAHMEGGLKDNAIPRDALAVILVESEAAGEELCDGLGALEQELKKEFQTSDPGITVSCRKLDSGNKSVLHGSAASKVLFFLRMMPNGIQNMSMDIEGLVETSLNAGIMKLTEEMFSVCFAVRSSVTSRKMEVADRLSFLTEFLGGEISLNGDYPAWEYKADSAMRELMAETYRDLFGEEAKIEAIHAGLECGLFSGKIPGLDCISFGPNMYDIHTPKERLSISSAQRTWKLIVEFLKRLK